METTSWSAQSTGRSWTGSESPAARTERHPEEVLPAFGERPRESGQLCGIAGPPRDMVALNSDYTRCRKFFVLTNRGQAADLSVSSWPEKAVDQGRSPGQCGVGGATLTQSTRAPWAAELVAA
jgi:hypothetical protein